jgi:hypothetical protein
MKATLSSVLPAWSGVGRTVEMKLNFKNVGQNPWFIIHGALYPNGT